jgi:DNA-directed RNA polymerase subunit M/transcription elongation factor TFIIS
MAYEVCPVCGANKHQVVACPKCGYTRRARTALKGTAPKASGQNSSTSKLKRTPAQKTAPQKKIQKRTPSPHSKPIKIILISRRGTRIDTLTECDECGRLKQPVWRYADSNKGTVYICAACKPEVFTRSYGSIDIMSIAESGGGIETNRRKH